MCIAISGEVIRIDGDTARVNARGNLIDVNISLVSASLGDRVLVHAGYAMQVMPGDEAAELDEMFDEVLKAAFDEA